ncbi:MAG: hypothetical protein RIS91_1126 [Bacteroidota bacterium]|jgi:hypothetical protein
MTGFEFNKVYVIESLDDCKEKLTGKELYADLLRWKEYQIADFKAEYISVNNKTDFLKALETIKDDCTTKGYYPILHFEIHGSSDTTGLVLTSGELVTWNELYQDLVALNSIIANNLFITLAVCHGGYIMELIKIDNPAPYWGFIGSFDEIKVSDLLIRYNEFYDVFLRNYDLNEAVNKLHDANPSVPSTYRFINSEDTFKNINKRYFKEKFSDEQIKLRFEDGLKQQNWNIKDRNLKNQYRIKFRIELLKTKKEYFEKHKEIFFMLKNFPDNKNRFQVSYEELN